MLKHILNLLLVLALLVPAVPAQAAPLPPALTVDPQVTAMLAQITSAAVSNYNRQLAGELPVTVDGSPYTITSRYTYSGVPIQKTTSFAAQHLQNLGLQVESQVWGSSGNPATYPNVIGEVPGLLEPEKIYMIGAHIDDVQNTPGADDNASGSVAVLLAADILSQYSWGCTLRFAFWTGEEQGMNGSEAYAARARANGENILGYLNLDMIAYNTKNSAPGVDLLYHPAMPDTYQMAQLFSDVVSAYELALQPEIISDLSGGSDHMSFLDQGYRSILVIEDQGDFNPYYHQSGDRPANNNLPYFTDLVKASLAALVHDAGCLLPNGVGTLSGMVTDPGGAAIPGALISVQDAQGKYYTAQTGPDGRYSRPVLAGAASVRVQAFGFVDSEPQSATIEENAESSLDFVLQTAPMFTVSGSVNEAPVGAPLAASVSALGTPVAATSDAGSGAYSLALPAGIYTLTAAAPCHQPVSATVYVGGALSQDFDLPGLKPLLLVDDDRNLPNLQSAYTSALDGLGQDYDVWQVAASGDPSAAKLAEYHRVLWYTGKPSDSTFSIANEDAAAAYLRGGGNFFLSSYEYLYDRGLTSFGRDYLGIASYADDVSRTDPAGAAGDALGGGLGPYTLTSTAWGGGSLWTDRVSGAQATPFVWAGNGQGNSARYTGGNFKSVFIAWPLETISDAGQRGQVLGAVLNWFGSCTAQPNTPPALTDLNLQASEDNQLTFSTADFAAGFSDVDPADSLQTVRITGLPAHGLLRLNGLSLEVNQEVPAASLGLLNYLPAENFNGADSFGWNASDGQAYAAAPAQALIHVAAVNDAPQVLNLIPDQQAVAGGLFSYTLPADTFGDADGDSLTLSAALADGSPLPAWLSFDGAQLDGNAPLEAAGDWTIVLTADDGQGGTARDEFVLRVNPPFRVHLPAVMSN